MSGKKCYKSHKHTGFDINIEVHDTPEICLLTSDSTGTLDITVSNYKGYPVYFDIDIVCVESAIIFVESETSQHNSNIVVPPARVGEPGERSITIRISQRGDSNSNQDCIQTNIVYYSKEEAEDSQKNDSVPDILPIIDLK